MWNKLSSKISGAVCLIRFNPRLWQGLKHSHKCIVWWNQTMSDIHIIVFLSCRVRICCLISYITPIWILYELNHINSGPLCTFRFFGHSLTRDYKYFMLMEGFTPTCIFTFWMGDDCILDCLLQLSNHHVKLSFSHVMSCTNRTISCQNWEKLSKIKTS